ncbi:MAG: hypothetical protein JW873_00780 [Candidatus Saganbacteria bacterium]|nr:hypothetical protein [Candidatus Saganbacteria bacterium]
MAPKGVAFSLWEKAAGPRQRMRAFNNVAQRPIYFLSFIFYLLFFTAFSLPATAAIISQADDATLIGGGARPIGMGRAFAAVADDADAIFINPAGLGGIKGPTAMAMFTNLLGAVYYSEYSGAVPTNAGALGLGYVTTGVNQIPTTDQNGNLVYTDYYDSLMILSYSSPIARWFGYGRNVFFGFNYRFYNRGTSGGVNESATGQSVDIGLKVFATPYLSFGVCRQNILPISLGGVLHYSSGAEESFASLTKVGLAARPIPLGGDLLLVCDADLPGSSGRPTTLHLGAEYRILKYFTVRAGLDQSVDSITAERTNWNPTFGLSTGFYGLRVDYAYHAYYNDPSLATTYVSLSYAGEPWLALKGGPPELPETIERHGH